MKKNPIYPADYPYAPIRTCGKAVTIFFVCLLPFYTQGQDFTTILDKSDPVSRLISNARYWESRGDTEQCRRLLRHALADAYLCENPARIIHSAAAITYHFTQFGEQDSVEWYARKLLDYAQQQHLPEVEMYALLIQTTSLTEKQRYHDALRCAEKARIIAKDLNDEYLEGLVMFAIGRAMCEIQQNVEESNKYLYAAQKIFEDSRDTFRVIRIAYFIAEGEKENAAKRNVQFAKIKALSLRFHDERLWMNTLRIMANYLPPEEALSTLNEALDIANQFRNSYMVQRIQVQMSEQWLKLEDYEQALHFLGLALKACKACLPDNGAQHYYAIYKAKGEDGIALYYLERLRQIEVEDQKRISEAMVEEWEARFQLREKDWFIEKQQRINCLLTAMVGLAVLLLIVSGWLMLKLRRDRKSLAKSNQIIHQQAEALRQLDEAKSRFFANVSHELRTPLSLMMAPIGTVLKSGDFSLLKNVQENGRQLLQLINGILKLAKLESNHLELRESPQQLYSLTKRIADNFESQAASHGIDYTFRFKGNKNILVLLDKDQFETMLNNLLSNALKFTPPGNGVQILLEVHSDNIRLIVSDTGRGIHPDDLPHVFDRFFQSSQPDAATEGGTGIGLALCQELAKLMQGRLWAESQLGQGSKFYFEFPKKETRADVLASDQIPESATTQLEYSEGAPDTEPAFYPATALLASTDENRPSVLVVEDHPGLREYLQHILSPYYRVVFAKNGQVALNLLQENVAPLNSGGVPHGQFQLILSDLMMPVMDGFQLLKALKNSNELRHIPVIMLTARADMQDKLNALRIGVDDYVLKPFDTEELLARMEALLRNQWQRLEFIRSEQALIAAQGSPKQDSTVGIMVSEEDQQWLAELETAVAEGISDFHFNIELLAGQLAMSRSALYRRIRQLTGLSPNEYINEVRFRQAKILLETRRYRAVKSVAYAVGMKDVKYFSQMYFNRLGVMPSAYMN